MSGIRVWLDRVPMRDETALFVTRNDHFGGPQILRADGTWESSEPLTSGLDPTLRIDGLVWRELRPLLIEALGGLPEAAPDTEVRVLREWLAVEQARVERAFDR